MRVLLVGEGNSELKGALEVLVRRLAPASWDIHHEKVSRPDLHVHHGKGKGYFKRAVRWMMEAEKLGFDALILLIDHDGNEDRVKELNEAQEYVGTAVRRAFGVAIKMFEAWMLADEKALGLALGIAVERPSNPEELRHPKEVFQSFYRGIADSRTAAEIFSEIAAQIHIPTLETRCSNGFAPFARRVRAIKL